MLLYINDLVYTFIMLSYFDEFWAMKGMNCFFFFFFCIRSICGFCSYHSLFNVSGLTFHIPILDMHAINNKKEYQIASMFILALYCH